MTLFLVIVAWGLCIGAAAAVMHHAEPFVDAEGAEGAEGAEHRYEWWLGALLGLLLGPFGFIVAAMYVQERTPAGTPKVAITETPRTSKRRRRGVRRKPPPSTD